MPKSGNSSKPKVTHPLAAAVPGTEAVRLRVRIPKRYHQEPVVTTLAQRYPLTVNIRAAASPGGRTLNAKVSLTSPIYLR